MQWKRVLYWLCSRFKHNMLNVNIKAMAVDSSHGDGQSKEGEIGATKHQVTELCEDDDDAKEHEHDAKDVVVTSVVCRPQDRHWLVDVEILQQLTFHITTHHWHMPSSHRHYHHHVSCF